MNSDFTFITMQGLELLVYKPWWAKGLLHGMTTRSLGVTRATLEACAHQLCDSIGIKRIVLPLQCHGSDVTDVRAHDHMQALLQERHYCVQRHTADAVIAPATQRAVDGLFGFGIMTADCVPIVVSSDDGYALIHAGWRGLANGVIAEALRCLQGPRQAVVFPAAGGSSYEVGPEVAEAIGTTSVTTESHSRPGFFMLDTAATAIRQLQQLCPTISVSASGICTINDQRFHSFRRDGERAGRGLTFVVPRSKVDSAADF